MAKIVVKDFNFYYDTFHALKNINMDIKARKVTALIGPSGCGKSTLLRSLNRMHDLYPNMHMKGEILYDGQNILGDIDVNSLRAKIGMVFQKPTPFAMSIYDNVAFGVRLYESLSKSEMDERVEWALQKAALFDEVKDKIKKTGQALSGGQQQRLCIARTIACRPDVLLLDEPTSALDPIATMHIEQLVSELAGEFTIVIVTHNMQQAMRLSHETAYMYLGELIEMDDTHKIFNDPAMQTTRDYISGKFG